MDEHKFKKGDRVRVITRLDTHVKHGQIGTVLEDSSTAPWVEFDERTTYSTGVMDGKPGFCGCLHQEFLEKVDTENKGKGVNFILRYELDEDPFETFETMKEVEKRIQELALDHSLKRNSIHLYKVSEEFEVQLSTKIHFSSIKNVEEEVSVVKKKARKKRGTGFKPEIGFYYPEKAEVGGAIVTVQGGENFFYRIDEVRENTLALWPGLKNYRNSRYVPEEKRIIAIIDKNWSEIAGYVRKPLRGAAGHKKRLKVNVG